MPTSVKRAGVIPRGPLMTVSTVLANIKKMLPHKIVLQLYSKNRSIQKTTIT